MNNPLSMSMFASRKDFEKACRRQDMVERCARDFADSLRDDSAFRLQVARDGFQGFGKMTDEELEQAFSDAELDL